MSRMTPRSRRYFEQKQYLKWLYRQNLMPHSATDHVTGEDVNFYFLCEDGIIYGTINKSDYEQKKY